MAPAGGARGAPLDTLLRGSPALGAVAPCATAPPATAVPELIAPPERLDGVGLISPRLLLDC